MKTKVKEIKNEKKNWVKPEIKAEELTMRALLGENGWFKVPPAYAREVS